MTSDCSRKHSCKQNLSQNRYFLLISEKKCSILQHAKPAETLENKGKALKLWCFKAFHFGGVREIRTLARFLHAYSLSRGAPSATWVLPRILFSGGESGIRTHGCFHIAGFQDRCFRPLSHLSVCKSVSRAKREYYITMYRRLCQQKAAEEIWKKFKIRLANWWKMWYSYLAVWNRTEYPGVAKFGIALEWGSRGLEFESRHSDQINETV